ncbi:MAG: AtpZ/AtpI family protein [Candidatus Dadabacteria bacterium]|nr:AtpZ/AtpI family protein [Candidatus Dadabacteria bacterium]NIS07257.1 AtpZ/AtpI family protein [Candidatus Dadabacteria bacterium]NIV40964.1 hypothetical protein [Candidatus Dadabacteria bacterium]NIY21195.1 hypothetical protein [Candidatus Dadabacteria bacterium]
MAVGIELAFSVIAGLVLGDYIDGKLKLDTPWFTFLGLLIGLFAGTSILIKLLKRYDNDSDERK